MVGSLGLSRDLEKHSLDISETYLTQSFPEHNKVNEFLYSSSLIKIIEIEAKNFLELYQSSKLPEECFSAILIKLSFVYTDFLNHHLDLLHFVIEEPIQFANTVKYCVFSLLRDILKHSLLDEKDKTKIITDIDIDQVHVLIRLVDLPLQLELCFQPHINLFRTGITEVIGILSAVSDPEKVVLQSVWYCSTGCERNKIKTTSLDIPICANCSHPMNEYPKLRRTQSCYIIRILPVESIESPHKVNKLFRAITVRVLEHVFDCQLILGERYLVIGYYSYFSQREEFEAWSLTTI